MSIPTADTCIYPGDKCDMSDNNCFSQRKATEKIGPIRSVMDCPIDYFYAGDPTSVESCRALASSKSFNYSGCEKQHTDEPGQLPSDGPDASSSHHVWKWRTAAPPPVNPPIPPLSLPSPVPMNPVIPSGPPGTLPPLIPHLPSAMPSSYAPPRPPYAPPLTTHPGAPPSHTQSGAGAGEAKKLVDKLKGIAPYPTEDGDVTIWNKLAIVAAHNAVRGGISYGGEPANPYCWDPVLASMAKARVANMFSHCDVSLNSMREPTRPPDCLDVDASLCKQQPEGTLCHDFSGANATKVVQTVDFEQSTFQPYSWVNTIESWAQEGCKNIGKPGDDSHYKALATAGHNRVGCAFDRKNPSQSCSLNGDSMGFFTCLYASAGEGGTVCDSHSTCDAVYQTPQNLNALPDNFEQNYVCQLKPPFAVSYVG